MTDLTIEISGQVLTLDLVGAEAPVASDSVLTTFAGDELTTFAGDPIELFA